jgi:adenylate kinase family enzyme
MSFCASAEPEPQPPHEIHEIPEDTALEEMFSFMNTDMEESDWIKVQQLLEDLILIINTDTGGQAEFLDLHASLVAGPSFNLLFSRLVDDLDSMFKIYYTNEDGVSTEEEDSTMTVEEVMFQALASIACFSGSFSDDMSSTNTQSKLLDYFLSKVMFVGTHRDLIDKKRFKEKDDFLKKRIKETEFYRKDMIEFYSQHQLMVAVDNRTGSKEEIERIRQKLEVAIVKNFGKIDVPVAWLLLSFCIRYTKTRTMSLETCEGIARKLNIDPEELQDALWFLHRCVGLLLYYPELKELKDTVICDIQVVFDSASNLIKNTFTFEKVGPRVAEKFAETGHFSQSDLEKAAASKIDSLLPLQNLVKLLEHLSILTPLPHSAANATQEPTYFMPCVLKSARAGDLSVDRSDSDPAPLMLRYRCGYVPVGVFPAMITNLVSKQSEIGWEMIEEGLRKNRIQFTVGRDFDTVTLISHPRFFEIVVVRSEGFVKSTESLCYEVLDVIESTLSSVTSRMNYNFSMGYKFGFECPVHSTRKHLCLVEDKKARRMRCLQDRKKTPHLVKSHLVWFSQEKPASSSHTSSTPRICKGLLIYKQSLLC